MANSTGSVCCWVVTDHDVLNALSNTWVGIVVALYLVIFMIAIFTAVVGYKNLPPGPFNWPILGAMLPIDAHLFKKLAQKYGPIFYYRMGSQNVVVVSSPQGAEEVLKIKDGQLPDWPNTAFFRMSAKYFGFGCPDISFSGCNDHLKILRKACLSHFFSLDRLETYEYIRKNEGAAMVESIRDQIQNGNCNQIEVRRFLSLMSTNIICQLLFGRRFSDSLSSTTNELQNCPKIVKSFLSLFMASNMEDHFPFLEWILPRGKRLQDEGFQQQCRQCYGKIPGEHRKLRKTVKKYQDQDFVDLLLTLHEDGRISENEMLGCIMNMLSAGIEISGTVTEWILLELVKNPETMFKLRWEINTVVGKDRQVEESDYAKMPYLRAVLKESFRVHNPVPLLVPHCNKSPTTLGGFNIPAKTTVFINAFAIGRDPKLWENPDTFNPDRFLGDSYREMGFIGGNYRFLPFGNGRRMCVGHSLGMFVLQRMVTTLVQSFDWMSPPGLFVEEMSVKEKVDLVTHPEEPLVLAAIPRLEPTVYRSLF